MMKLTFIFLFLSNFLLFGQNQDLTEFYEAIGKPVLINKQVVSYTISHAEIKNGKNSEVKMNNPSVNNPYNIFITSDESKAIIRINNKNLREDMVYNFKKIYKILSKDSSPDQYNFTNSECNATYFVPKNIEEHQSLIIGCENSSRNGLVLIFTISQLDEL
ncbi:MAG: hypothetical protein ACOH1X_01465 [Kaistella sp.]